MGGASLFPEPTLGEPLGALLGLALGLALGEPLGLPLGELVGLPLGELVGLPLGLPVGLPLGLPLAGTGTLHSPPPPKASATAAGTAPMAIAPRTMVTWVAVFMASE